jgi:hypothetical protein
MVGMYAILKVLSVKETQNSSLTTDRFKELAKTSEAYKLIMTGEFRELVKTTQFRNLVKTLADEQIRTIANTMTI